jgi:hypothetical protein
VLLPAQPHDPGHVIPGGKEIGGEVVELGHLPPGGPLDPVERPTQRIIRKVELEHRLGHPLVRRRPPPVS